MSHHSCYIPNYDHHKRDGCIRNFTDAQLLAPRPMPWCSLGCIICVDQFSSVQMKMSFTHRQQLTLS